MSRITLRDAVELANAIFSEESQLLMFNTLVDIASGDMIEEILDGTPDPFNEPKQPSAISTLGLLGGALCFGSFSIGPDAMSPDEATVHLREALAKLQHSAPADLSAILPLFASEVHTIAAVGVTLDDTGNRVLRYWRHPDLDPDQAAANLLENFEEAHGRSDADAELEIEVDLEDIEDAGPDDDDPDGDDGSNKPN